MAATFNIEAIMRRWAWAAQRRNLESLSNARGPGGPPLAPNRPATIKKKGHDRVGFWTGQMARGFVSPVGIQVSVGANAARAVVYGNPGDGRLKVVNIFVRGQRERRAWASAKTKSGKRKAWQYMQKAVPGRDFFGVDERDVDAAGNDMMESMLRAAGFA